MAQRRRKEKQMKRQQQRLTLLCIAGGLGAVLLSLIVCLLVFDITPATQEPSVPVTAALPYDTAQPFSLSDLTASQLTRIRESGRITVSDGPRGISIGDTLDELLARYPSTIAKSKTDAQRTGTASDEDMMRYSDEYLNSRNASEQTGLQSDEEMILYCAEYFENQNGVMVALPPRGLLTVRGGSIVVTLLAPTTAYPAGTQDNYGSYEHVYCVYTIEPDTMTVSSIVLGMDQ